MADGTATIEFVTHAGVRRRVTAPIGETLMRAAVDAGIDEIAADCGGTCTCATCHIYLDGDWAGRVPSPDEMEESVLELVVDPQATSRLSCQVRLTPAMDGIVVHLPRSQF